MRRAARKDKTQAEIVQGLKDAGYLVDIRNEYGKPDLNVRHPSWPASVCVQLESKSPNHVDGSYKPTLSESKRRQRQQAHCLAFGVPYVVSGAEALKFVRGAFSAAMALEAVK